MGGCWAKYKNKKCTLHASTDRIPSATWISWQNWEFFFVLVFMDTVIWPSCWSTLECDFSWMRATKNGSIWASGQKFTEGFGVTVAHQNSWGGELLFSHAGDDPRTVLSEYLVSKVVLELVSPPILPFNCKS